MRVWTVLPCCRIIACSKLTNCHTFGYKWQTSLLQIRISQFIHTENSLKVWSEVLCVGYVSWLKNEILKIKKPEPTANVINTTQRQRTCHMMMWDYGIGAPGNSLLHGQINTATSELLITNETAVASIGWVTPGAATEGITLYFFLKNLATFFAHHCHYHYRFLLLSLGCHPLQGVTSHLFLPIRPRFSTILCKFALECHPLDGVTRGGPP